MSKYWKSSSILFCLMLLPQWGVAASDTPRNWELHGFVTQGYFNTDDNNISGDSESGSFDFREIGLNASWHPAKDWLLSGQLMSRRMGEVSDGQPRVDYALVDYRIADGSAGFFGTRLGRVKIPYGLYNDTRDVAFTRPSILLPQSIYLEKTRNILLSADGVMLYGSRNLDSGVIDSELLVGHLITDSDLEQGLLGFNAPGELDSPASVFWRLHYKTLDQRMVLGYTLMHAGLEYEVAESGDLFPEDGDLTVNQLVLSAQYNLQRWSFTSEYFLQKTETKGFGLGSNTSKADGIYFQADYRVSPQLSLFMRRELGYTNRDDRNGKMSAALGRDAHRAYNRDWVAGVGWSPNPNWLFKAELHKVKGTSVLSPADNPDSSELKQHWNILALQATYRF